MFTLVCPIAIESPSCIKRQVILSIATKPLNAPAYNNNLSEAWLAWNKSQGEVMQGLINRRNAEIKMYNQGVYERW